MKTHKTETHAMETELIGYVLGDAPASPALTAWMATAAGKRTLAAHRRVLGGLDAWGAALAPEPRRRRGPRTVAPSSASVVYYGALATRLGPLLAAVNERGLVGVSFGRSARAFGADLARRQRARVVRADERLARMRAELDEYLSGKRRRFDVPVDLRRVSDFQRRVLMAARRIPRGRVLSYGEIARRIGQPGASRAVGQALGRNPVPIVYPVSSRRRGGGRLGGYAGGSAIKKKLLALEGVQPKTGTWS
jgi:methylated-DNA-[protein]-cysteine S-methyltransferase